MAARLDRQYTQEEIDEALALLIAFAGNAKAVNLELKAQGKKAPCAQTLKQWAQVAHWERYEELRERFAAKMESKLTNDMLDASRRATEGAILGTDAAIERLEAGDDKDPARTAANLAMVGRSFTDKRLALQGRPTTITETRDAFEIMRKLVQMGVLQAPDEPPSELPVGAPNGDPSGGPGDAVIVEDA